MVVLPPPSRGQLFLWWLAAADVSLLQDHVLDRNRFSIQGWLVAGTWAFATLAWTFFFTTVLTSFWAAAALGALMGWIILHIDRSLIKSLDQSRAFVPVIFRMGLALGIGLFMAQPALLFLFDREVQTQATLDNQERVRVFGEAAAQKNSTQKIFHTRESKAAQGLLAEKYQAWQAATKTFLAESDGTGGSGKIGLSKIAAVKREAMEKAAADYQDHQTRLLPLAHYHDSLLRHIVTQEAQATRTFQANLQNGFLTRIEALEHLVQQNGALAFRYYLLVLLLLLIELMPLLGKLSMGKGAYAHHQALQEKAEKARDSKAYAPLL
ncbi:MAG: DUF4407 domain-containing protein [Sphingobacteriia bacterium]|nr:MAG: DUF4407 domain-containing protein [Sphingobacteriia bacterium]